MSWNKLAAIGDRGTILPLKAVGIDAHIIEDAAEAPGTLRRLAQSKEYGIIFVVEALLEHVREVMNEFSGHDLPAIILIPHISGSEGRAASIIRETMKKAAGYDVVARENE